MIRQCVVAAALCLLSCYLFAQSAPAVPALSAADLKSEVKALRDALRQTKGTAEVDVIEQTDGSIAGIYARIEKEFEPSLVDELKKASHLRRLAIRWATLNDETLARIAQLDQVIALQLKGVKGVTPAGLAKLQAMKGLKDLWVGATSDEGLSDAILPPIAAMTQLERLNLRLTRITDKSIDPLAKLTKLKALGLGDTGISGKGIVKLKALPLEELDSIQTDFRPEDYLLLKQWPKLRILQVDRLHLPEARLSNVVQLVNVEDLTIYNTTFTADSFKQLLKFTKLRRLSLQMCKGVPDEGIASLAVLKDLESLDLRHTATDGMLAAAAKLPKLQELDLRRTSATAAGIKSLESCKGLRRLYILLGRDTKVAVESLKKALPDLRVIDKEEDWTDSPSAH